ncbi:HNH endonuclease signature motif containing protein [Microbacterium panaciterrae]|uniref:HNH nuclease domain-containing protein n=1 Tax=Microbacterium panaciterrae TaxID=985759 RepID=A0ABP8PFU5_9MICO
MSESPLLTTTDRGELLDAWVAKRAQIARLEGEAADLLAVRAGQFRADVKADPQSRDMIRRSMIAEYSAAGHISTSAAVNAFAEAEALDEFFPLLRAALRDGTITLQHVRVLIAAAAPIRDAVANGRLTQEAYAVYEAAVLVVAEQETPARSRNHARQIAAVLAEETLRERNARATAERSVTIKALEDGMALITAVVPEIYAVAIKDRLTRLANAVARSGMDTSTDIVFSDPTSLADAEDWPYVEDLDPSDPRLDDYEATVLAGSATYVVDPEHALDEDPAHAPGPDAEVELVAADGRTRRQIEADLFIDLLLASSPSEAFGTGLDNITATIQVTVAATTLAGEDDRLAELDGHGPLHPDLARALAHRAAGWNRLFLDGDGMVTKVDRYTPTEAMKRFLRARDQRCRFPGCHTPAGRCQIDHNHDHALGGQTEITNLADLCLAHHTLKHPDVDDIHRWTARQLRDGTVRWTSPLGRTYDDRVPRRVMFV